MTGFLLKVHFRKKMMLNIFDMMHILLLRNHASGQYLYYMWKNDNETSYIEHPETV